MLCGTGSIPLAPLCSSSIDTHLLDIYYSSASPPFPEWAQTLCECFPCPNFVHVHMRSFSCQSIGYLMQVVIPIESCTTASESSPLLGCVFLTYCIGSYHVTTSMRSIWRTQGSSCGAVHTCHIEDKSGRLCQWSFSGSATYPYSDVGCTA